MKLPFYSYNLNNRATLIAVLTGLKFQTKIWMLVLVFLFIMHVNQLNLIPITVLINVSLHILHENLK